MNQSRRSWGLAIAALVVAGCTQQMDAVRQMARQAWSGDTAADAAPINPQYRYLRVATREGRVALLVLGYVDPHPQGPIEVFYSSSSEALRLQNGRVVGAVGTTTEWRNVELEGLPRWPEVVGGKVPAQFVRVRDVMPGYRYRVRDELELRAVAAPAPRNLKGLDPGSLRWFEEVDKQAPGNRLWAGTASARDRLPPALYGIAAGEGKADVVYAEQCLSADLCISWQRWPVNPGTR